MYEIPVYAAEKELGLADLIRSNASIAYVSPIIRPNQERIDRSRAYLQGFSTAANRDQIDLYYLDTILVTTGWNKNDDIFLKEPTWAARKSAEDKPFNYNHDQLDIIGHITSNVCVDSEYRIIADNTSIENVPDKFHILTSSVIYRSFADQEQAERIEKTIAEIERDEWFVSMECIFRGFDYTLADSRGEKRVIARNEKTAFLSKYLRSYGGKGVYNGETIGRALSNITFSGKGLVRNPANPESIIFSNVEKISAFKTVFGNFAYKNIYDNDPLKGDFLMDFEKVIAELKQELAQAKSENASLKSGIDKLSSDVAKANDERVANLTSAAEDEKKKRKEAEDKAEAAEKDKKKLKDELDEVKKDAEDKAKANDALAKTVEEFKKASKAKSKGADEDEAKAFVDEWKNVDEATFDKVLALASATFKANRAKADEGSLPLTENSANKKGGFKPGDDEQDVNKPVAGANTGGNAVANVLDNAGTGSRAGAASYTDDTMQVTRAHMAEYFEASREPRRGRRNKNK